MYYNTIKLENDFLFFSCCKNGGLTGNVSTAKIDGRTVGTIIRARFKL